MGTGGLIAYAEGVMEAQARRGDEVAYLFRGRHYRRLEWRGIHVSSVHIPHVEHAQGGVVVNDPSLESPFIRIHETKHASGQQCEGTALGFEFANASACYYPVETQLNRALDDRYQDLLREQVGAQRTFFAGHLANYLHIDMGDCMGQALDAGEGEVVPALRRSGTTAR